MKKNAFRLLLVIGGTIGFLASFILTTEKIELLKNASYQPPCNISPIISCGSVMKTPQAEVFGFPNALIGIAGFAIVVTVGMALLAEAKFKRWFWLGLEAGTIFGVVFIHWLFFQSVYVIGALCPFCMIVWTVTIPIFLYTTLYNLQENYISKPKSLAKFIDIITRYHASILFLWYLAIITAILIRFWYYWVTFL
jgi:uncharacterized membrane protein